MNPINFLPKDGEAYLFPDVFSVNESNEYLHCLVNQIEWKHEPIIIFGKSIMQPRLTAWYGDKEKSYRYSGITMNPLEWTEALLNIKLKVEEIAGVNFNSVLLNQYRNGKDYVGWHRDNEKELGINPIIASVSFGVTRNFQLQHCKEKNLKQSIELTHGSVLIMRGETQHHWLHCLPKRKRVDQTRVNLTFRYVVDAIAPSIPVVEK